MNKYTSLFFWFMLSTSVAAQRLDLPHLPPVDESAHDPQLKVYIVHLRTAVQKRDKDELQKLMAPDILLTFGPPPLNVEEFLGLTNPDSPVWNDLEIVLQFGGTFLNQNLFCIPYIFTKFPHELGGYAHQVTIRPSVIARKAPAENAPVVATLEFAIVRTDLGTPKISTGPQGQRWARIYVDGQTAYVPENSLRSPIDIRACFEKRAGGWLMSALVGGD
jgi:hypothetical protein